MVVINFSETWGKSANPHSIKSQKTLTINVLHAMSFMFIPLLSTKLTASFFGFWDRNSLIFSIERDQMSKMKIAAYESRHYKTVYIFLFHLSLLSSGLPSMEIWNIIYYSLQFLHHILSVINFNGMCPVSYSPQNNRLYCTFIVSSIITKLFDHFCQNMVILISKSKALVIWTVGSHEPASFSGVISCKSLDFLLLCGSRSLVRFFTDVVDVCKFM